MVNPPEILALGPNNCFARWNNLIVQWWHETRLQAVDEHMAILQRLHRQDPGPFAALIVVEPSAPLPEQAARRRLDILASATMERCNCLAYAYQGTGFAAAAVRGIMAAITMTSANKIPKKVCSSIHEALSFMAPYLDDKRFGSPAERAEAVEMIRMRFAERPRTG
ncbi:MAG: hypothetical protein QM778_34950 [Myxococcales bacterium]